MEIGDWLGRRARLSPEALALRDATRDGWSMSYAQWNRATNRAANLLRTLGVAKGDRVAVLARNRVEFLDVWFACGKLGAILQPLNWRLTPAEIDQLLGDSTPRLLIYDGEFLETVRTLSRRGWMGVALDDVPAARGDRAFAERAAESDEIAEPCDLSWDDPWVLCYTGGSTGQPKGAILTHGNLFWNAVNTVTGWGLRPDDVTILNAPLFHTGGLNVFTAPLVQIGGASIVCRGFDADQVFDLVESGGVTLLFGVPTMFLALVRHPRWPSADLSRLRLILSGGAPCPPSVFQAFFERGLDFRTGYGLTEAGPNTFWLPQPYVRGKPGCVGAPLFWIDAAVVDSTGHPRPAGEVGELWIRGPHVFAGYWNRREESGEAFRNGWLRTGDLASRDAEGHYWITGRIKDLIISGGENIYPAEIEAVLTEHPDVAEAAVIGASDPTWGESVCAIVVARERTSLDAAELLAHCARRLARFKRPRSVVVVESLPRTAAGKVDKSALRQRFAGEEAIR